MNYGDTLQRHSLRNAQPAKATRLHRIVAESAPQLDRYRAEEDSAWQEWSSLSVEQVLIRLRALREEIISRAKGLSPAELGRVGIHPLFGEMSLALWVEFFLLHE